jgi:hypothetical protein
MDFSGYADMAVGLARMFNLNLPINFDDPFRAVHRFDLWRRWHITFVEFMRTHVFRPLARIRWMPMPAALAITGMLSGFWHGLGWTFVLWGIVQTVLLLGSHYWNHWRRSERAVWLPEIRWVRIAITFATTASIGVLFRAPSLHAAAHMYAGLVSLQQIPTRSVHLITGSQGRAMALSDLIYGPDVIALLAAATLVWLLPQTSQLFAASWTAIDPRPGNNKPAVSEAALTIRFRLSPSWGISVAFMLAASLAFLDYARRFVYVQF